MTKEEVIKRLTAFGFLQEETSVVVNYPIHNPRNIRTRTEAIPAMVYKLPYHDEKLAFFQIPSHYPPLVQLLTPLLVLHIMMLAPLMVLHILMLISLLLMLLNVNGKRIC